MAESSGFFPAMLNGDTGKFDRAYFARQFAKYFSLFVGNGVFGSPTNQLLVVPGDGFSVVVKPGYAFIDGYWYENSTEKQIVLVPNYGSTIRTDTVRVRMSLVTRDIKSDVFTGDTEIVRGEDVYDLLLATVSVQPMSENMVAANIHDTRPDQAVCGFVTGLMKVQTTADLFNQFQSMFDEWFDRVKGQLSEDAAGNLQTQIDDLQTLIGNENKLLTKDITGQLVWCGATNPTYIYPNNQAGSYFDLFVLKTFNVPYVGSLVGYEIIFCNYAKGNYVAPSAGLSSPPPEVEGSLNSSMKTTGRIRSSFSTNQYPQLISGCFSENGEKGGLYFRNLKFADKSAESLGGDVFTLGLQCSSVARKINGDSTSGEEVNSRYCVPYACIFYGFKEDLESYTLWENGVEVSKKFYPALFWKDVG